MVERTLNLPLTCVTRKTDISRTHHHVTSHRTNVSLTTFPHTHFTDLSHSHAHTHHEERESE